MLKSTVASAYSFALARALPDVSKTYTSEVRKSQGQLGRVGHNSSTNCVIASRLPLPTLRGKEKRPLELVPATFVQFGSAGRTRTYNPSVNSRMLCH